MKALLSILFSTILSLYLKQDLGELFLTQDEFLTLDLSDYFVGSNLTYSITDSNIKNQEISIQKKPRFELLSFLPFSSKCGSPIYSHPGLIETRTLSNNKHYLYGYHQNCLEIYYFESDRETLTTAWSGKIETEFANTTIENVIFGIQGLSFYDVLIIQVKQLEVIENTQIWRNDILLKNLDYKEYNSELINLNLSEITYASKIIFTTYKNMWVIIAYGEFPEGNKLIFYMRENESFKVFQIITKVVGISGSHEISIISLHLLAPNTLYVHEKNFGIIIYKRVNGEYWSQSQFLDLNSFGALRFITLSNDASAKNSIFICTNSSMMVARSVMRDIVLTQFHSSTAFASHKSIEFIDNDSNNFYFIQYKSEFKPEMEGANGYKAKYSLSIYRDGPALENSDNCDLSDEIGDNFYENGLSKIIKRDNFNEYMFYLRLDLDGLRVFKIRTGTKLEVRGNLKSYAQITVFENNGKNSNISSTLNLDFIPKDSESIYLLNNSRPYTINPIVAEFSGLKWSIRLNLDEYFSAPNLNYSFEFPDLNFAKFNFVGEQKNSKETISKLFFEKRLKAPEKAFKVEAADGWIYYYFNDHVEILKFDNQLVYINSENPIKVIISQRILAVYWRSNEGKFMLSMYNVVSNFESSIFNEETETECKFLVSLNFLLICANSSQIDFYVTSSEMPYKSLSLKGTDFLDGNEWNLIDLSPHFLKARDPSFVCLLNASQELFAIDLQNILMKKAKHHYMLKWKVPIDTFKIDNSNKNIYLFKNDGEFNAYSLRSTFIGSFFTGSVEILKSVWCEDDAIFIQLENQFILYDISKPSHSNPIFSIKTEKNAIISLESMIISSQIYIFYPEISYIDIYNQTSCNWYRSLNENEIMCSMHTEIDIFIERPEKIKAYSYNSSLKITGFNEKFSKSIEIPLKLNFNGAFMSFKNSKNWAIDNIRQFDKNWEINLQEFFIGHNISFYLRVNDIDIREDNLNAFPAEIAPKSVKVGEFSLKKNKFFGQVLIPDTNIIIILTGSELILTKTIGFQNNFISVDLFNATQMRNISCQQIDILDHNKGNLTLIFTTCTYDIDQRIEGPAINRTFPLNVPVLILFEMDFISGKIINFASVTLPEEFNYIKAVTLNETKFELLLSHCPNSLFSYEYLGNVYRFSGIWDSSLIEIRQIEIINALTLGVKLFNPNFIYTKVRDSNTVFYYFSDHQNGIYIVKAKGNESAILVREVKESDFIGTIGICGDQLYVLDTEFYLASYLIKDYVNFELKWGKLWISVNNFRHFSLGSELACSQDGRFISFPYYDSEFNQLVRIIDSELSFSSKMYTTISTFNRNALISPKSIRFVDPNIVSIINGNLGMYASYQISPSILKIREISQDEFFNLTYQWETDEFEVVVIGGNEFHAVKSDPLKFKLEGPKNKQEGEAWDAHWWVWAIITITVIFLFLLILYFIKYLMSKRKKLPLNRPIMMTSANLGEVLDD